MQRPIEIQKLMNRKGYSNIVGNLFYSLMVNCHQPYSEIKKIPIPLALALLKNIKLEQDKIKKQSKKKKW